MPITTKAQGYEIYSSQLLLSIAARISISMIASVMSHESALFPQEIPLSVISRDM
jgi:hypothetical protein